MSSRGLKMVACQQEANLPTSSVPLSYDKFQLSHGHKSAGSFISQRHKHPSVSYSAMFGEYAYSNNGLDVVNPKRTILLHNNVTGSDKGYIAL